MYGPSRRACAIAVLFATLLGPAQAQTIGDIVSPDGPPTVTPVSGPSTGSPGVTYTYSVAVTDPEGEPMEVEMIFQRHSSGVQYDDRIFRGPVASGSVVAIEHKWPVAGKYCVFAVVTPVSGGDPYGNHQRYTACRYVTIGGGDPSHDAYPDRPTTPSGPSSLKPGESAEYHSSAWDPDSSKLKLIFTGQGSDQGMTIVEAAPGETASVRFSWSQEGRHCIRVYAREIGSARWGPLTDPYCVDVSLTSLQYTPAAPLPPTGRLAVDTGSSETYQTKNVAVTTDTNDMSLKYVFDWDDGTTTTTGWVSPDKIASASHQWWSPGDYCVSAMSIDEVGQTSPSSGCVTLVQVTGNQRPTKPSPPSGSSSGLVDTDYEYTVSTSDPDGDSLRYTVSWGDGNTRTSSISRPSGVSETFTYAWPNSGTYCVRVRASDGTDDSLWSSCRYVTVTGAPSVPAVKAESWEGGSTATTYDFEVRSTEPDGEQVRYHIDWGDGTAIQKTGFVTPGQWHTVSHKWSTREAFCIKVRAEDVNSAFSDWSACNTFTIRNDPPGVPTISGPTTGLARNTPHSYGFKATDPDSEEITYSVYWGDQGQFDQPEEVGPSASGAMATASHSWGWPGSFCVEAWARDASGEPSEGAPCYNVQIINDPPAQPTLTVQGEQPTEYEKEYTFHATAEDSDDSFWRMDYVFDWDDGTTSRVQDSDILGERGVTASHTWSTPGSYCVRARADDQYDYGPWSNCLNVVLAGLVPPDACGALTVDGMVATLDVSCTTGSPDGRTYVVDWGDGSTTSHTSSPIQHSYMSRGWGTASADHIGAYGVVLTVENDAGQDTAPAQSIDVGPSDQELARYWAPVFYQDTAVFAANEGRCFDFTSVPAAGCRPELDEFIAYNFDGDYRADNNWDNALFHNSPAAVYYHVTETTTAYYIGYAVFHPRDEGTNLASDPNSHENDIETVMLMIQKDGSEMGRFEAALTMAHNKLNAYAETSGSDPGCTIKPGPEPNILSSAQPEDSGDAEFDCSDGGKHIVLDIEHGGHGIYRHGWIGGPCVVDYGDLQRCYVWDRSANDFNGGDGNIYYPGDAGEIPSPRGNDRNVKYELLPIDALWDRRYDVNPLGGSQPEPYITWGGLRNCLDSPCKADAHAPWAIFHDVAGEKRHQSTWFEHPSQTFSQFFFDPTPDSRLYVYRSVGGGPESFHGVPLDAPAATNGYDGGLAWVWHRPGATSATVTIGDVRLESGDTFRIQGQTGAAKSLGNGDSGFSFTFAGDTITLSSLTDSDDLERWGWAVDQIAWS